MGGVGQGREGMVGRGGWGGGGCVTSVWMFVLAACIQSGSADVKPHRFYLFFNLKKIDSVGSSCRTDPGL